MAVDKRMEESARTQTEFANALRDEVRKTIASFGEGLKADVKTLTDAIELRDRGIQLLEMANSERDPLRQQELLTFLVVGGGFTGVELAGEGSHGGQPVPDAGNGVGSRSDKDFARW